jgi:uncharacterized protein YcnI
MTTPRRGQGRRARLPLLIGVALVAAVLVPSAASAHVSLHPETVAPATSSAVIALRVPNERTDGATTGVRVQFPRDHPIVSATVRPKPGWTFTVKRMTIASPVLIEGEPVNQAIDEIEWRGGSIGVGEFDDFEVNIGPIPADAGVLYFPTIQTYDKGEPVSWIERPAPGGGEPQRPAPSLHLAAGAGGAAAEGSAAGAATGGVTASTTATGREPAAGTGSSGDPGGSARLLALAALVLALASLAGTVAMLLRGAAWRTPARGTADRSAAANGNGIRDPGEGAAPEPPTDGVTRELNEAGRA